jgi:hypothetical protein
VIGGDDVVVSLRVEIERDEIEREVVADTVLKPINEELSQNEVAARRIVAGAGERAEEFYDRLLVLGDAVQLAEENN